MLLDRLLANLTVDVEPFAVCEVSSGWRLHLDGAEWVTLHFVLEGSGSLVTSSEPTELSPFTLAVVPPRVPHAIESGVVIRSETSTREAAADTDSLPTFLAGPRGADDLVVVCGRLRVSYGGGVGLFDLLEEAIVLDFRDSPQMRETFVHLLEEERALSPGAEVMMTTLLRQCLVLVLRRLCETPQCTLPWLAALDDPGMARVLEAILENPGRPYSVDSLAAMAYLSRSAFVEQFTVRFGQTPMTFVRQTRLRRAAELLRSTDLPVEVVARRVGYASRSQFSRAFNDYYGRSPAKSRAD